MGKANFTALEAEVVRLADVLARDFAQRDDDLALDSTFGTPLPPPATRAGRLHQLLSFIKQYLVAECTRPSHGENARALELLRRVAELDDDLYRQSAADPEARDLEPRAWALARDARRLARFAHATIARPRWPSRHARQDARSVFVSGALPGEFPKKSESLRGVQLLVEARRGELASERWNQLRTADLAIFRLHDSRRFDREEARVRLATTCYELGIALTLGLSILILADEDTPLPFDAPFDVFRVRRGFELDTCLLEALEEVAFGIHWGGDAKRARAGLEETLEYARRHFTENLASEGRVAWAVLAESIGRPHEFVDRLELAVSYCRSGIELVYPAWPARYPKRGERRCFHASASANWAEVAGEVVRDVCRVRGAIYSHSRDAEPGILRAAWDEVCSASHLIADLTDLDAGVALELGIAHALGKPCLLVLDADGTADDAEIRRAFPAIAGDVIHPYFTADRYEGLERSLADFLAAPSN
jgi:nucleoside 2-deoxyribosyltransferase